MNRIRYAQDQNWDTTSLLSTFRLLRTDEIVLGISGKLSNSTNHNVFFTVSAVPESFMHSDVFWPSFFLNHLWL